MNRILIFQNWVMNYKVFLKTWQMDHLSKEKRSWNMSRISSKDTAPELTVRSLLHRNGFRFRLHVKDLPGKPDIVLPKYKTVIEVRGCFWHLHDNCPNAKIPATKQEWWINKLTGNKKRDLLCQTQLLDMGWRIFVVWSCLFKYIHKNQHDNLENFITTKFNYFLECELRLMEISYFDYENTIKDKNLYCCGEKNDSAT